MRAAELLEHDCARPSLLVRLRNKPYDRERMQTWFIKFVQTPAHVVHNKLVFALMEGDWSWIEDIWSLELVRDCATSLVELYD
jgi:hypothetical protein